MCARFANTVCVHHSRESGSPAAPGICRRTIVGALAATALIMASPLQRFFSSGSSAGQARGWHLPAPASFLFRMGAFSLQAKNP